ncbi:MAG TPA: MMPL family transporter [Pseudomonadota bacterium]|nr:MMPL family transporter [Pseudomonadota bacterium]
MIDNLEQTKERSIVAAFFGRYIRFADRRAGLILISALILAALVVIPVTKLELRTDLAELLPETHESLLAMRRIAGRQKSATNLIIILQSPDKQANYRLADSLRPILEGMVPSVFTEIQWKPDSEIPEHAAKWKWMLASVQQLENAEDFLDRLIAKRKSPLFVDLEGNPEDELRKFRKDMDAKLPPIPTVRFFEQKKNGIHSIGIMLWKKRDGFGSLGDRQMLDKVRLLVSSAQPKSFHANMEVRYTGHIALAVDEQQSIQDRITYATILCISLIAGIIYFYFRRVGLLFVIVAPTFLGVLLALLIAQVRLSYLNINTAFLVSIIIGNGINTPIMLLARYGEERHKGQSVLGALAGALSATFLGTLTAMLAASIAYGSLMITEFRGFSQFGLIGGAGMLLVWLMSMILVPPVVIVGERRRPGMFTPRANLWSSFFSFGGRLVQRFPVLLTLFCLAFTAVLMLPLSRYIRDPLEWNFNNLRSDVSESQSLWGLTEELGMASVGAGYIGNNGVLLVDMPDQADPVADALRAKDAALGPAHVLAEVRTLHSVLPKDQDAKLAILNRIRKKIDQNREMMSEDEWRDAEGYRPPEYLRRLTPDDLPRLVREAFTEVDGQRGRLIGMDLDYGTVTDWDGHDLLRIAKSLKVEALGKTWVAASAATVFAGMVETIVRDGPKVAMTALLGVLLLVMVTFGPVGAIPVLLCVLFGVAWLGGLMGWLQIKLNFMNFVTLPITLGVGADYAANMWGRLRHETSSSIAVQIGETGSAVALCSATTVIGYSTLLLSNNRALRSFGLAADIGEVTCLFAALLVLPAVFTLLRRFRRNPSS